MTQIAIIGGTGLTRFDEFTLTDRVELDTPFGKPSSEFVCGQIDGKNIVFLARHGDPHSIPPHKINYRANIWGLKQLGVEQIIAVAAVGGITSAMAPAHIAIPDQIIDYSYGRQHTFFEDGPDAVTHIDFTHPYTPSLRARLILAAAHAKIAVTPIGTYGCTQGPRLETTAEIARMERDGCDLVGMTGMPEAALAKEQRMDYAAIAVVANWAAGKTEGEISMEEIERHLHTGMAKTRALLKELIALG
ncbi:MAG: S-methyl-5'-thioadenosine phosphorylase [Gammaproteobacteria bacterium HGW-Gammaproteobacteria-3]|nr:MAG: S-methyl-5'-thioadenosine phosphorylase [Gammaproteobacteria bacterium HGW-Gammaproteobacteria-3]